jgi:hypothetical protein
MNQESNSESRKSRPHLGVHFRCCNVYSRIYLNAQGESFVGWCPKCAGKLEVKVDPCGSTNKFFGTDK